MSVAPVQIDWNGRSVAIEYRWIGSEQTDRPLLVFLHEGLGSVSMWRDFPQALCDAAEVCGLVFSRPGYGRSTPRAAREHWGVDFMHRQAFEVLPALFDALQIGARPRWLFGHSDGASIALLHAARFPASVSGVVVLAPHIVVEDLSIASIQATREAYLTTDLRTRLERHHADVDSAFWGWNDIWLDPAFRRWNIEAELDQIACPVLAIQGLDDEYGTLEQIHGIGRRVLTARLLELPDCGHSPHRDHPVEVIAAAARFIAESGGSRRRAAER